MELGSVGGAGTALSASVTIPGLGDTYYSNVSLLLHGDGNLTDTSGTPKTVTAVGGATATGPAKFGSGSFALSGSGQYLSVPYSSGFDLSSGDWTIECWANPSTLRTSNQLFAINSDSSQFCQACVVVNADGSAYFLCNTQAGGDWINTSLAPAGTFTTNTWKHVAAVRSGSQFTLYVGGVSVISFTSSSTLANLSSQSFIGYRGGASATQLWTGAIDDFRVTKGVARYTSAFTPPTAAFSDATSLTLPVPVTGTSSGLTWAGVPASATATGTAGSIAYDGSYFYLASAQDTWVRAALSTWALPVITIGTQPSNQTASSGSSTFSVTASVTQSAILSYQWQKSTNSGSTWTAISGATSASLALSSLTTGNNSSQYRVVVSATGGASSVTSNAATLTVSAAVAITYDSMFGPGTYSVTGTNTITARIASNASIANSDTRLWLLIGSSGTLSYTVTASSEDGYDGGRLYLTAGSPASHSSGGAWNVASISGLTNVSAAVTGTGSSTGTISVTAGQYLVLRYLKDAGDTQFSDNITATLSIA
jgi:hypothetical protein